MPGNNTGNTTALIRQDIYSSMILDPIFDTLMSSNFATNLTEFTDGDRIRVPLLGEAILRERTEGETIKFDPLSSSRFDMEITEHVSSAHFVTLEQEETGYLTPELTSRFIKFEQRAILERFESTLMDIQKFQTAGDLNEINGTPHRFVATGPGNVVSLIDIMNAGYALSKANVPSAGRLLIVDPFTALELDRLTNLVNVSNNKDFMGMVTTGFRNDGDIIRNIGGFQVVVSNYLAEVASETIDGVTANNARVCLAMSVQDFQTQPFAFAWRRMPRSAVEWNEERLRREYATTARWGTGLIRHDGLVSILSQTPTTGFSV